MVGHLSLSRDHHSNDLVASLRDILEANSLVDCMISAEGQYLKAHKLILSACSPYFQSLFREEADKYPIVLLKDIEFEYLKLIINFVYCGEVQVLDTQLNSFLEVAKFLQIKGLNASSRECSPERSFSDQPASPSMHENESQAINEIMVDDDDCEVIDLAGASASEVHEQSCADSSERPFVITDESTFSLATQGNRVPASHDFIRAADQEWHSRPVSPVSVTSITSVKTEQLVDCDELNGHSGSCSVNEDTEYMETEQVAQANGTWKHSNSSSSVNADLVKEIDDTTIVEHSNPAERKAKRSPAKRRRPAGRAAGEGQGERPPKGPPKKRQWLPMRFRARNIACPHCPKKFARHTDLTVHSRRHTGERPFVCTTCGQRFSQTSDLKRHQLVHSGERPFACDVCGKRFNRRSAVTIHARCHTGERPYACPDCDKTFAAHSQLWAHRNAHREGKYSCDACGLKFKRKHQVGHHWMLVHGPRPRVAVTKLDDRAAGAAKEKDATSSGSASKGRPDVDGGRSRHVHSAREGAGGAAWRPLPAMSLRLLFQQLPRVGCAPARAHRREALQVHAVPLRHIAARQLERAPAKTHRGEAVCVFTLWDSLCIHYRFEETYNGMP